MENRSHALAAGFFTLVLALAAAVGVWWLGQSREATTSYLLETRKNVTGLNVQAQVRYRGIRAGKVEMIEPDPNDPRVIQIRISLDSKFKLTRSATAQLGYQGVTGLAYVQIEDDGAIPELLGGTEEAPAKITLKATLLDTLGERAGDIVTEVNLVASRLAALLNEKNAQNLSRTLDNVASASDGLRDMPRVMASMREVLSDGNLRNLKQILVHVEKTAGETAPLTAEVREMVKSMTDLSTRLDGLVGGAGDELTTATLPRANALMRDLAINSRQLSRVLDSLEDNPQMLILGRTPAAAGPGEAGFTPPPSTPVAPAAKGK